MAAAWAFPDEGNVLTETAFERVHAGSATVPSLWWYEIRNVLLVNERRKRIMPDDLESFLSAVSHLNIEVRPPEAGGLTLRLARKHGLTVYDASYLALSISLNLPLATLDKRLQKAAETEEVSLLA